VTRDGARIIKGDIKLRLASLPPPPKKGLTSYPVTISTEPQAPTIVLAQLTTARTLINACLDVVDITSWAGDGSDAAFVAGQLRLLDVNLQEAKAAVRGTAAVVPWWREPVEEEVCIWLYRSYLFTRCYDANKENQTFNPALPPNISVHFYINEAALVLEVRTLEALPPGGVEHASSAFSFRDRIGFALGTSKPPNHDEVDDIFSWRGQDVKVREKVRVESSDPKLMAALAKLNSLERSVALARRGLDTLMGRDD
jgi:Rogdi leucine zipper containing protein